MINAIESAYGMSITDFLYLMAAIIAIAGIVGFIYEEIFYRIDLKKWVKRGSTYGPWIPIYGIGGLLLALIVYHFRAHWIVVFLLSFVITGAIEWFGGWLILKLTGKRLWDYNTEIRNWGNNGGFVCLRTVVLIGIGGLAQVNLIFPIVIRVYESPHGTAWKNVMLVLFFLFILDIILHRVTGSETHRVSDETASETSEDGNH